MNLQRTLLLTLVSTAGAAAILQAGAAKAGAPALIRTAVPASQTLPLPRDPRVLPRDGAVIEIAADQKKNATVRAELQFDLAAVPGTAMLKTCAVRVVLAEGLDASFHNGVLLQLRTKEKRTVAAIVVPPATPGNTAIVLRDPQVCTALKPGSTASLFLETNIANARLGIYGHIFDKGEDSPLVKAGQKLRFTPSLAPRLMLTYQIDDAQPGDADWGQLRRDAQHSARSRGRLYDPDGAYAPAGFEARTVELAEAGGSAGFAFRQSPFLWGDLLWTVMREGTSNFRIRGFWRSGASFRQSPVLSEPKYMAAGGQGHVYYASANKIVAYPPLGFGLTSATIPENAITDIARLDPTPMIVSGGSDDAFKGGGQEVVSDAPTVGSDGALYVVTGRFARAYAPPPNPRELWRYPTYIKTDEVGPVTLSDDEATAYVLTGGDVNSVRAIDAATGDCLWEQKLGGKIVPGPRGEMPIPVVAGRTLFVASSFPASNTLFVVRDGPAQEPAEGSEMVPVRTGCGSVAAPGGTENIVATTAMSAPSVGPGNEALYLKSGALCWSRGRNEGNCVAVAGCSTADLQDVTLLVGDSSGGVAVLPGQQGGAKNANHLYGLYPGRSDPKEPKDPRLIGLTLRWSENTLQAATCVKTDLPGLGPNLILAPDGTLYNYAQNNTIQKIVPKYSAEASARELEVSTTMLKNNDNGTIRAPGTIRLPSGSSVPASTDVRLVAGNKIVFAAGFSVGNGARLRARAGF